MPILAVADPIFQPAMRIISAITNSNPAVVTTTFDHNYISDSIVRLYFPLGFGMEQVNKQKGTVTVTGLTTFTIDIDTTEATPFVVPIIFPENKQKAQVIPVGELNSTLSSAVQNVLPY